ncbi:MAG: hypothetical protein K9K64_09190 [Desulfohalobiaceae bacterium]|nr:hypothetical protein [Desulfohalobiaceae bacterium]
MAKKQDQTAAGPEQQNAETKSRMPDIKKRIENLPLSFIEDCFNANYLGDGKLFYELHYDMFLFDEAVGESNRQEIPWYVWAGHYWKRDLMGEVYHAVENLVSCYNRLIEEIDQKLKKLEDGSKAAKSLLKKREAIIRRIDRIRSPGGRNGVLHFAHTIPNGGFSIDGGLLNQNKMLLPLPNGVLDLRTGELWAGKQDQLMTKALPVEWRGIDARRDLWLSTLWEMFEDQEKINLLQRWFGYCLTGEVYEQKFVFFYSPSGRSGKGVICEIYFKIMGPFAAPLPVELLLDQGRVRSPDSHSSSLADGQGIHGWIASETNENQRFNLSNCKWLSGGDTIICRRAHAARSITFEPTHKLMMMTNHEPSASPGDTAFWDRMLRIDFPYMFVNEPTDPHHKKRDPNLIEKLKEELPGILAWMVEGCLLWQLHGLNPPPSILEATKQYQENEEDPAADFIAECCYVPDKSEHKFAYSVSSSDLYEKFKEWYMDKIGPRVPSKTWFGRRINKRFTRKKDDKGRAVVYGVGLLA